MKENLTALLILTLIITGSFLSINYTKNVSEKLLSDLKLCEEEVVRNNWTSASTHIDKISAMWKKHKSGLSIVLSHRDIIEITDLIVKVSSLVHTQEKNAYITENKRLTALVESISKQDILTFENLF